MKYKHILMSVAMAALVLVSLCAVGVSALSVSAAQGSSANVKAPTLVGAPVGSGAPAVCSVDGTVLDLFIRGADNVLYFKISPDGVTWPSTSASLGGVLASAPAAASRSAAVIDVFVRGTDGRLYQKASADSGTNWSPNWINLEGQLAPNTGPAVCSWGGGRLDVFVQGTDGGLWHKWWSGTSWSGWEPLGGKLTSAPAATATATPNNQIGVFVAGTNGALYYNQYSSTNAGKGWTGWVGVGGQVLAGTSPAAYNFGASQIGWFVTGTDSKLYQNWVDSTGKTNGYASLGGTLTSSPAATAKTPGVIDVFARGSTGQFAALYQISFNYPAKPGQWGVWTAIGGV